MVKYPDISLIEKKNVVFSASDWEMKCPPTTELDLT